MRFWTATVLACAAMCFAGCATPGNCPPNGELPFEVRDTANQPITNFTITVVDSATQASQAFPEGQTPTGLNDNDLYDVTIHAPGFLDDHQLQLQTYRNCGTPPQAVLQAAGGEGEGEGEGE